MNRLSPSSPIMRQIVKKMTSAETAAAALAKIRLLKRSTEEVATLRQENAELQRRVREMAARHEEAVLDLLTKGKKLEDLMRHVIEDRNRIAAQLTSLQSGPRRATVGCQTASPSAEQCDAVCQTAADTSDPTNSPAPAVLLLSPEGQKEPPASLQLDVSGGRSPALRSSNFDGRIEFGKIPASCVVGLPRGQWSAMLLVHVLSAQAVAAASQVRLHWRVQAGGASIGLYEADGSIEWVRVPKVEPSAVGISESGDDLAWCSALPLALQQTASMRNANLCSLMRRASSDRLHGPFPLETLKLSVVASRMTELGDMLILDGVAGEAVSTATAQLGKSRVFLVSCVQVVCGQSQVTGEWLPAEDIYRRFTTVTIVERWPRPRNFTEVRIPVTFSGGCSNLFLAPLKVAGCTSDEGPSCDVSVICATQGQMTVHLCSLVPLQDDLLAVQCESVLDSDRATVVLVSELDELTNQPLCRPLQLLQAPSARGNPVPTAAAVQVDGVDRVTAEVFATESNYSTRWEETRSFADFSAQANMAVLDDDGVLSEQRQMLATMTALAAQVDAIELKAASRLLPLFAADAGCVVDHFLQCSDSYENAAGLVGSPRRLQLDWWLDCATAVAADHVTSCMLPAVADAVLNIASWHYRTSARLVEWSIGTLEMVSKSGASEKFSLFLDAAPLSRATTLADESFPWADDFVHYCSKWAAASEMMWQRALSVSCAAVDEFAAHCAALAPVQLLRAAHDNAEASTNTDAATPTVAQQACDSTSAAAQLAMFREPFMEMLQMRGQLERECFALRVAITNKEQQLQDAETHLASLAMGNDALAAELSMRDVELEAACRRLHESLQRVDELQGDVIDLRSSQARMNASQQLLVDRHAQQLAEKGRSISSLEAEVASLRHQLEALKPALLSLTAPTESDMRSVAGSVAPASSVMMKKMVRVTRR